MKVKIALIKLLFRIHAGTGIVSRVSRDQNHETQQWIDRQLQKQVPADYFMLTFTLPAQFRSLAWQHQLIVYGLLFDCVWATLKTFCLNDKKLGGIPGAIAVLHTNSRELNFHPHVHFVMPATTIDKSKRLWAKKTGKYLFNQKALVYLGQYLYRGVISEKNILSCDNGKVSFRYQNSKTKKYQTRTVSAVYFLWLVLQHILPRGFRRARDYGFLHPNSKKLIKILQWIFRLNPINGVAKSKQRKRMICSCCGAFMNIIMVRLPNHFRVAQLKPI